MRRLKGIGVSPGVVAGRAVILIQRAHALRYQIAPGRVDLELLRLESSRARSREQLLEIRARIAERHAELASLFDAQLLMLDDPMLLPRAIDIVREQRVNAEWAIQQVFHELSAVFDDVADPYLQERKGDVSDLVGRLRMNLRHGVSSARDLLRDLDESSVLIADELTPSLAAQVDWTRVRGFATDAGSKTYHTAILARSLDVPAVVGLHNAVADIEAGSLVVIDGTREEVIVDPTPEELDRAAHHPDDRRPAPPQETEPRAPAATADGVRIRLDANIEFPDDLAAARYAGAEGIGLYRSEFMLAVRADALTDEDRQYDVYRRMVTGMAPGPVTVRTFDVDEDQLALRVTPPAFGAGWDADAERAGRQGLRGLRLSLRRDDLFRTQLRALLRAAQHGHLRIMFPFVSTVDQVRQARAMVAEAAADLKRRGIDTPVVPIGVVIEIPAAAFTADLLAREVDFLSIGTNDLIQYFLAVDRADARVSALYEPLHPAILRIIRMVARAGRRQSIPVSLCGEMAADPALLALLVGLGLTEFSMTPGAIGVAKQVLSAHRWDELRALARRVLRLSTADEIGRELAAALGNLANRGVTS
jgi:phosphotransferase system enzyme I (PtsI)